MLQENYEDGVLSMIKVESEQVRQGLDKIFQGLQKHVQLQDHLKLQYQDINNLHDVKTPSYTVKGNFIDDDIKHDTSNVYDENYYYEDYDSFNANSVKKEMWNYGDNYDNTDADASIANIKVEADICDFGDNNAYEVEELEEKPKPRGG